MASPAPVPAPQKIALVVECGTDINELLDGVFASENWSVHTAAEALASLARK